MKKIMILLSALFTATAANAADAANYLCGFKDLISNQYLSGGLSTQFVELSPDGQTGEIYAITFNLPSGPGSSPSQTRNTVHKLKLTSGLFAYKTYSVDPPIPNKKITFYLSQYERAGVLREEHPYADGVWHTTAFLCELK